MDPHPAPPSDLPSGTPHGRYPAEALAADGLRAAAGLLLCLLPFAFVTPHPLVTAVLLAAALPFALIGVRTLLRLSSRLLLDETGLTLIGPLPRTIRWEAVDGVRLRFYATKRDRSDGWMELTVRGGGQRITVESGLSGFPLVVARVAAAARDNRLALDSATRDNLLHHGEHVPLPR